MPNCPPGKGKAFPKPSLMNLSVEEENLAAIPFAVLERRVGKRVGKIEISGSGDVYLHSDPKTLDTDMHGSGRVHKVGAGG